MSYNYLLIQWYSNPNFYGYILIKIIKKTCYIYIISITNNIKKILKKLKCKEVNLRKKISKFVENKKFWNGEDIEWDFLNCEKTLQELIDELRDIPVLSKPLQ